jgi:hypothetical protein
MPKAWGGCLGRAPRPGSIIGGVSGRAANVQLLVEIDSDPISGSVSVDAGAPREFRGWIELVAAIESVRHATSEGLDETLGAVPGARRGVI